MPSEYLVSPDRYLSLPVQWGPDKIRELIAQRHEMEQLSGILLCSPEEKLAVGFKDVTHREFWARGHFPGHPLMPGVVMLEVAAQLCAFYYRMLVENPHLLAFAGLDEVKFRGQVAPGQRLIMAVSPIIIKVRQARFNFQGYVGERMVLEGKLMGITIEVPQTGS